MVGCVSYLPLPSCRLTCCPRQTGPSCCCQFGHAEGTSFYIAGGAHAGPPMSSVHGAVLGRTPSCWHERTAASPCAGAS